MANIKAGRKSGVKKSKEKRSTKAIVTFDIDTGKVVSVTDEHKRRAKSGRIRDLMLNCKKVTHIPDHTVMLTHSSPGCFTYFFQGRYYEICM